MEDQVSKAIKFMSSSDALKKQEEGIAKIKKSKAFSNIKFSIILFVLGVPASIYGFADVFGGKTLPMGVIFLIGGPIMFFGGIYKIFISLLDAAIASQANFESDLERLCSTFYSNVFCKKATDFITKDDQIVDVCQFIPITIIDKYIETIGWSGLAHKWLKLRSNKTDQDIDFTITSLVVDKVERSDKRVVDVTIHLSGTPFGSLTLSNVAFNIEGRWFLVSPEPVLV
mgnify:CR=1 FL=1